MSVNPLYIAIGLGVLNVVSIGWLIRLEIKMLRLLKGKNAESLEDTILDLHKKLDILGEFRKDSLSYFGDVEKRITRSIQAVETVRFNPFKGSGDGGNQSFSTALLSEHGDGVVISSLYSRDRISIFGKPLSKFQSEFELTEEECALVAEGKKKVSL